MSNVSERTEDALWRMYLEHCTHMRHHETQRSTVAASLVAIAGALLSVAIFDRTLSLTDFPILLMVFALGLFGALFSAKQYERSALHMQRARFYRNAIDEQLGGLMLYDLKRGADERHAREFPILRRFRINKFWLGLYIFIAIAGLSLSIIAIAPPSARGAHQPVEVNKTNDNRSGNGSPSIAPPQPDYVERPRVTDPADASLSVPIGLLALVVVLSLGAFLWFQRQRIEAGRADPVIANRKAGAAGLASALAAMGAAWVAIGDVESGWKIALPALIAPLLTYLAAWAGLGPRARAWVLGLGVLGSLLFVMAHLTDRAVRWQPREWAASFLHNLGDLLGRLSFADYGAMFVALLAYAVALRGAAGFGEGQGR